MAVYGGLSLGLLCSIHCQRPQRRGLHTRYQAEEDAARYSELCQQTDDDEHGGLRFAIDKSRISIRLTAPYSTERKIAASQRAKTNSIFSKR